ncbi:hypothetical protein PLESTB_000715400 [Pleodorina starrii]|uniref:J domain-containing protein n=1 Tax=Pleodorina starrii TaxID=330485 RepID=A0A9W6BKC1_9CHLO|nr:hypothetical protein PLESTM_000778000 [Pleodorina starrii]GLC48103.1 hypothetical protein PLESTB_000059500 [Pleodorina starrii]GLC53167.1 hypothetical protein PLESTB_000715400 [Pleodorina starrii]GLC68104.1 hypothetical protein PLESTF_000646400 [Pleodorina starrii]
MSGVNYYQLLGIHATATDGEIRRAYRTLLLQYHPDKRRTPDAVADELYRRIQEAYETLSCPEKRCLYDFVGSFAALAELTSSCPVPMPATGSQRRSAVTSDLGGGLWSRSSSGETLHSWGTSSFASATRLSPCPSSDTHLSSSPADATGMTSLGPGNPAGGLAAACGDPATATSSGGGSSSQAQSGVCGPAPLEGASAAAAVEAAPAPGYPGPHASSLQPQPHPHLHLQHHHQHQHQQQDRRPFLPPELKLPTPAEPGGGPPPSPHAAGAPSASSAGGGGRSPVSSPGTLLGKRRTPGADDSEQQHHHHQHQLPHPFPHPHPQSPQPQPPMRDAPGGGSVCRSPTAAACTAAAAAAAGRRSGAADVHHRLLLTLEEMYSGCVKQLRLARRVYRPADELSSSPPGATLLLQADLPPQPGQQPGQQPAQADWDAGSSHSCWRVEELFRVVVQPGWREGTKVTFPGKGDELPCGSRGDMVLVVSQAAHCRYERRGNDLHTVVVVPLVDALTGGDTALTTLDGRRLVLPLGPSCLQPFSQCVLKGEGMPIPPGKARGARAGGGGGGGGSAAAAPPSAPPSAAAAPPPSPRGDLHVRFEVSFPADLTPAQKAELRQALLQ